MYALILSVALLIATIAALVQFRAHVKEEYGAWTSFFLSRPFDDPSI